MKNAANAPCTPSVTERSSHTPDLAPSTSGESTLAEKQAAHASIEVGVT
jgi:hypothetical protein